MAAFKLKVEISKRWHSTHEWFFHLIFRLTNGPNSPNLWVLFFKRIQAILANPAVQHILRALVICLRTVGLAVGHNNRLRVRTVNLNYLKGTSFVFHTFLYQLLVVASLLSSACVNTKSLTVLCNILLHVLYLLLQCLSCAWSVLVNAVYGSALVLFSQYPHLLTLQHSLM